MYQAQSHVGWKLEQVIFGKVKDSCREKYGISIKYRYFIACGGWTDLICSIL